MAAALGLEVHFRHCWCSVSESQLHVDCSSERLECTTNPTSLFRSEALNEEEPLRHAVNALLDWLHRVFVSSPGPLIVVQFWGYPKQELQ